MWGPRAPARPLVIGHRGSPGSAAENTLASFEAAAAEGADAVETDVRRTADGVAVLHHDADLADGRPLARARRADLPPSVPTLDQAVAAARALGLGVNLEVKVDTVVEEVLAAADALGPARTLVSSFDLGAVDRVRAGAGADGPATAWLVLSGPPDRVADRCARHGHRALNAHVDMVGPELVAACRDRGLALFAWTVADAEQARVLISHGVDGLITDCPATVRRLVGDGPEPPPGLTRPAIPPRAPGGGG